MPGLVYGCGCLVGTERFRRSVAANMGLIAFGVVVCAVGEVNLVPRGLLQQLTALGFEVRLGARARRPCRFGCSHVVGCGAGAPRGGVSCKCLPCAVRA
jgi:hypothetical protein